MIEYHYCRRITHFVSPFSVPPLLSIACIWVTNPEETTYVLSKFVLLSTDCDLPLTVVVSVTNQNFPGIPSFRRDYFEIRWRLLPSQRERKEGSRKGSIRPSFEIRQCCGLRRGGTARVGSARNGRLYGRVEEVDKN